MHTNALQEPVDVGGVVCLQLPVLCHAPRPVCVFLFPMCFVSCVGGSRLTNNYVCTENNSN